ncbi:MAG: SDR family oxidoreductase [Candidatus Hydrogenedentota bacterium]
MNKNYIEKLFNLEKKRVLITGAAGQIGKALVGTFLECGAIVLAADLDIKNLKKNLKNLTNTYDTLFLYTVDIRKKESVSKMFGKIFREHRKLDVLINNAGASTFEPFLERSEKRFNWVMDVNLKGTFFCIQKYARELIKSRTRGVIVNIGSIYGVISPDYRIYTDCKRKNSEVYGATKAAIIQMTRYYAVHLSRYGIRVNCVSPGGVFNPQNPQGKDFVKKYSYRCPLGRMAMTDDIVGGVLYLSSDASQYVTGQNLIIDGGMSCW